MVRSEGAVRSVGWATCRGGSSAESPLGQHASRDDLVGAIRLEHLVRFQAVQERVEPGLTLTAEQSGDKGEVTVRLTVSEDAFRNEDVEELDGSVFVVGPERRILPGLALPRMLLEEAGGRLEIDRSGGDVTFRASVPSA